MALSPGTRLGAYEIRGAIGAGGMGEVYRAHDPRLGRDVALKILPDSMAKDPEGLARFTREARAVAALNHPHIVTIHSTEEADGVRFMTMELIEGRTLDRMIPQGGVSLAQFFDVSMAIADALSAAHQKQIIHRDLKPANVMVTDAGRVKVLDFGLARGCEGTDSGSTSIEDQATRQKLTQAGTILGTMPYMSPEQIEAKAIDGRSDIFSLGIVMYEMATGGRPFRGATSPSLMSSIMKDHPKTASELRPDLPGDVSRLVGKCLEKSPRDRMQTAHEILVELRALRRAWESGASPSAKPAPPSTPLSALPSSTSRASNFRVAVLPLLSRTAGGDAEALADGLTDDITAGLARFPYLRVVSRPDAEAVKGQAADARASAALGARYLLDGTARTSGGSVRISVRLVDGETGAHMWAETFDRTLTGVNLFDLQDDLASRIVATVGDGYGVLVRSMAQPVRERSVEELTIHELVLRFYAHFQTFHAEEHRRLCAGFEKALITEPAHALGWAMLSTMYEQETLQALNLHADAAARRRFAAERAIELDPSLQQGWRCVGISSFLDRDLAGLRVAADRVQQLNPLNTSSVAYMWTFLACAGDWERAIPVVRRCMDLNPQHPGWFHLPTTLDHYRRAEYEDALKQAKLANLPHLAVMALSLAAAAGQLGRATDGRAAFESLRKNHPDRLDAQTARDRWARFVWDPDLLESLAEGFEKAQALVAAEPDTQPPPATSRPSSGPSTVRVRSGQTTASSGDRDYVVAIHPFTSHGSDEESTGLARGLTEDIGTALSRFQFFTVRTSKEADARYVVEGSVRRSGNSIRVSARLIDTDTGVSVWAENYDRTLGAASFFDLQDEITARVVSTIGSSGGPFLKAMAAPLREQPVADLSLHELVLRYTLYLGGMRIEEHALLRTAFEEALAAQPSHALGWATLSTLYDMELTWGLNPLPDSMGRSTRAARRSVEIDLACQLGWGRLMTSHFHINDWNGMRNAGDRVLALNPLNQNTVGVTGMCFAFMGDWERGIPMVRRAIDLDPNHVGLLHIGLFVDHYRKKDYEEALAQAKRINAFETATVALSLASAAGQLGRADEARAALEALDRNHPKHKTVEAVRSHWAWLLRDDELIDRLIEGFEKAQALVAAEPPPV